MTAKGGVGFSNRSESLEAAREAVSAAIEGLDGHPCDLLLLFATSKHEPEILLAGARGIVGPRALILGGGAVGVLTNEHLGYGNTEVGAAAPSAPGTSFQAMTRGSLRWSKGEAIGEALGRDLTALGCNSSDSLLLMFDSIRGEPSQPFNMVTPILEGLMSILPEEWPSVAGLGMMGSMDFRPTFQFSENGITEQSMTALGIRGGLRMDTIVIHGCKPASDYHLITKTDGAVVLEIDGKPALQIAEKLLGSDKSWEEYPLYLTLGINRGDKFGEFEESHYANRLCMAIDRDRSGLVMFEPDLKPGDEVQIMRRSIDFSYMRRRAAELMETIRGRSAKLALYIDCIGRASAYSGSETEDAEEIQKFFGSQVPLLGLYSGVEIAKVGSQAHPLDWTGVLCVFSESEKDEPWI